MPPAPPPYPSPPPSLRFRPSSITGFTWRTRAVFLWGTGLGCHLRPARRRSLLPSPWWSRAPPAPPPPRGTPRLRLPSRAWPRRTTTWPGVRVGAGVVAQRGRPCSTHPRHACKPGKRKQSKQERDGLQSRDAETRQAGCRGGVGLLEPMTYGAWKLAIPASREGSMGGREKRASRNLEHLPFWLSLALFSARSGEFFRDRKKKGLATQQRRDKRRRRRVPRIRRDSIHPPRAGQPLAGSTTQTTRLLLPCAWACRGEGLGHKKRHSPPPRQAPPP